MCRLSLDAPDQLESRCNVAPLIAAADLQRHSLSSIELQKIVRLEQHVRKLGEGDAALDA